MNASEIETAVKGERERIFSDIHAQLAQVGRSYPTEFVTTTADYLFDLVSKAIEERGLPEDILRALELARVLTMHVGTLKGGSENGLAVNIAAEDLIDCIPEALQLIKALGGAFHTADSLIPFEPSEANRVISTNPTT